MLGDVEKRPLFCAKKLCLVLRISKSVAVKNQIRSVISGR